MSDKLPVEFGRCEYCDSLLMRTPGDTWVSCCKARTENETVYTDEPMGWPINV